MCALSASRPLPYYASPLVGREAEIGLVQDLISDPDVQLITITGTAGIGKTRLSVGLASEYQGGESRFIPLPAVQDPDLVPVEIAKALEIHGDDLVPLIRERLGSWRGLILLDNFEQVILAAPIIAAMLPRNPDLTIIVTSQRALQIEGEHVVRLNPLATPEPNAPVQDLLENASVQLLVNRATAQDLSFQETLEDPSATDAIAEICRELDGIPLAIELAASRLSSLSPEVVLSQLQQDQSILSTSRPDTPERQRTMHSAIAWSYCLLPTESQRMFLWLGTFTSGFDLDIVERLGNHLQVSMRAVDLISELMGLSLIRRARGGQNPWYTMLVSIRQFCVAELDANGEREAAQSFVAEHVLALANQSESHLTGPKPGEWSTVLDQHRSTIRSAVTWALDHEEPELPMVVATGLTRYMETEGRWHEAIGWIDQALTWRDRLEDEVLIAGLIAKVSMLEDARHLADARQTADEVRELLQGKDLPAHEINFLVRMGNIEQDQHEFDLAMDCYQQALELAERHGRERDIAMARTSIGFVSFFRGDYETAFTSFLQVKEALEKLQDATALAVTLSNLAAATMNMNRPEEAISYLDQAIEIDRETGSTRDILFPLLNKAGALIILNELDEAEVILLEAVELAHQINHRMLETTACLSLADIALRKGEANPAGGWLVRALPLMTLEDGIRLFTEMGWLLAHAMVLRRRYADAAAMLAKSLALANEEEVVIEETSWDHIHAVNKLVDEHLDDADAARAFGESWSTDDYVRNLHRYMSRPQGILVKVEERPGKDASLLTGREREILQLLIDGQSTQGMAESLSVSPRTITTHIGNIMAKMEVNSRAEVVAKALRQKH